MPPSNSFDYFSYLNLINSLYPGEDDTEGSNGKNRTDDTINQLSTDKGEILNWGESVIIFETEHKNSTPTPPINNDIFKRSKFISLLDMISRRYLVSGDPSKAINRFDYGKEKDERKSIRDDIRSLHDLIINFYQTYSKLLYDEDSNDSSAKSKKLYQDDIDDSSLLSDMKRLDQELDDSLKLSDTVDSSNEAGSNIMLPLDHSIDEFYGSSQTNIGDTDFVENDKIFDSVTESKESNPNDNTIKAGILEDETRALINEMFEEY